jgi:uncharacterized protein YjiS (DUF1127 family)
MINMNFLLIEAMRLLHGGIEEGADCATAANGPSLAQQRRGFEKNLRRSPEGTRAKDMNVRLTMAYVNSTRAPAVSFSDRLNALVKVASDMIARRKIYTQTVFELSSLSDRDLADLGISRTQIGKIAREAAFN